MSKEVAIKDLKEMIFVIRGQRVMIDADLARLYGVPTGRLNEAVKRNINRFPERFMFQLRKEEKQYLSESVSRFQKMKYSPSFPKVFTEYGAVMLANVLNSETAIKVSIEVVEAFIQLKEFLETNQAFMKKFEAIEKRFEEHDQNFKVVFEALRQIMNPPTGSKRPIGFANSDKQD